MKKFKDLKNKEELYISFIYFLVASAILANFSQMIVLKYKFGNFNFGEMILIMLNDSYTGYFTFPFLLGFILMIQSPVEQNIFFTITRYSNRNEFYKVKHIKILENVFYYITSICVFSLLVGIGNSAFSNSISRATQNFSKIYLFGSFETNILIFEIIKILILQVLLLYFFSLIHALLTQFRISQSAVFVIYTGILIVMAGMTLGFFGEVFQALSLFSISSSVYSYGINFIGRFGIILFIDLVMVFLNFKIFEKKI